MLSLDDAFNVVLDNTPHDASCGVLVGFLEGTHARTASLMSPRSVASSSSARW